MGTKILQKMREGPLWGRRLALLGPVGQCALAHSVHLYGELFFFLIKKEPVASDDVSSDPFVSAETLKACALIGLHLLVAEAEAGSGGSQSPDLGDKWRHRCPMSPKLISSCSAHETSRGCDEYEHNNDKRGGSALSRGLGGRASGIELPHGN